MKLTHTSTQHKDLALQKSSETLGSLRSQTFSDGSKIIAENGSITLVGAQAVYHSAEHKPKKAT